MAAEDLKTRWRLLAEAVTRNPRNTGAALSLGTLALSQSKWALAERLARSALAQDPNQAVALHVLGQALIGQERWPEAEKAEAEATSADEHNADAWCGLGRAREQQVGKERPAREAYEKALRIDPEHRRAREACERLAARRR
jgi:tetratricopeptide (TPR) repeat protein